MIVDMVISQVENERMDYADVFLRQRCVKCRAYFGFGAQVGTWCSRKCAGLAEISSDPALWPREHFTARFGSPRREKVAHPTREFAEREAKRWGKDAYQCSYCSWWHTGSRGPAIA